MKLNKLFCWIWKKENPNLTFYKGGLSYSPVDYHAALEIIDDLTSLLGWEVSAWSEFGTYGEGVDWCGDGCFIYVGPKPITEDEAKQIHDSRGYNRTST